MQYLHERLNGWFAIIPGTGANRLTSPFREAYALGVLVHMLHPASVEIVSSITKALFLIAQGLGVMAIMARAVWAKVSPLSAATLLQAFVELSYAYAAIFTRHYHVCSCQLQWLRALSRPPCLYLHRISDHRCLRQFPGISPCRWPTLPVYLIPRCSLLLGLAKSYLVCVCGLSRLEANTDLCDFWL